MAKQEKRTVEEWLNQKCTKCGEEKPHTLEFFHSRGKAARLKDGTIPLHVMCKVCTNKRVKEQTKARKEADPEGFKEQQKKMREKHKEERANQKSKEWAEKNPDKRFNAHLKRNYSISIETYNEMLKGQKGQCKICGTEDFTKGKSNKNRPFVDHCHTTGKVRGLLCHHCNAGLGHFLDDTELLLSAINYLKDHNAK